MYYIVFTLHLYRVYCSLFTVNLLAPLCGHSHRNDGMRGCLEYASHVPFNKSIRNTCHHVSLTLGPNSFLHGISLIFFPSFQTINWRDWKLTRPFTETYQSSQLHLFNLLLMIGKCSEKWAQKQVQLMSHCDRHGDRVRRLYAMWLVLLWSDHSQILWITEREALL